MAVVVDGGAGGRAAGDGLAAAAADGGVCGCPAFVDSLQTAVVDGGGVDVIVGGGGGCRLKLVLMMLQH